MKLMLQIAGGILMASALRGLSSTGLAMLLDQDPFREKALAWWRVSVSIVGALLVIYFAQ